MIWRISILIEESGKEVWRDLAPYRASDKRSPYNFESQEAAERMARVCYPDQIREQRLDGKTRVKVRNVELFDCCDRCGEEVGEDNLLCVDGQSAYCDSCAIGVEGEDS